ncbi:MAG: sodium:calcium antiporter [Clostridia bacterium]|jgi:cation:H+ antiporter|nr:sodium:calcium antiporter [Clostridia bacterium]
MFDFITGLNEAIITLIVVTLIINFFSNKLGDALHVLGIKLKMPDSVRGATLDAVASSFPEFSTAMIAVLATASNPTAFDDVGVPTIAGSGVFNILVIPMLSLFAYKGLKLEIHADRKSILRDAIFYIVSLTVLVFFGMQSSYSLWAGVILVGIYVVYVTYLITQTRKHKQCILDASELEHDMKYREILMWTVLGISAIWIGIDAIVKSVMIISTELNIPAFVVSVVILASATSIPDTILSIKSARRGDINGAVSNAVGSNIFNICMCLGLPMIVYYFVNGYNLASDLSNNLVLIGFLYISMIVTTILLVKKKGTVKKDGYFMLATYVIFIGYIVSQVIKL